MARLYIANVTRQRQVVMYRLDFNIEGKADLAHKFRAPHQVSIEPGAQTQVGGDFHPTQIQSIMDQLQPVGGVGVEEMSRLPKTKVAYILSVDRPVPARAIKDGFDHNQDLLKYQGRDRRAKAAVAANRMVEQAAETGQVRAFEMELEKMPEEGDQSGSFGEGYRVDSKQSTSASASAPKRGGSSRRRASK